jgi:hypothetical protein
MKIPSHIKKHAKYLLKTQQNLKMQTPKQIEFQHLEMVKPSTLLTT